MLAIKQKCSFCLGASPYICLGGAGLWLFSNGKRSGAKEKMDLLMNEGKIKKYFSFRINPKAKYYALTLNIGF
jgi:hypothetical protein